MKIYTTPERVFRVGHTADPWALAPWKYGPFEGRFDDPDAEYRVRYAGLSSFGAFVERISRHRTDLDVLAELNAVEHASLAVILPSLPPRWLEENASGSATLDVPHDNGLIDLITSDGIAAAYPAVEHARRRAAFVLRDYDASTLLSGTPRRFTQAISRYVYDNGFAGIAYRSRFAPEELCVALFESRHALVSETSAPIAADDADLLRACDVHHIAPPASTLPEASSDAPR